MRDITKDVLNIKLSLQCVIDEMRVEESVSDMFSEQPMLVDDPDGVLCELIQAEKWAAVLAFIRQNNPAWHVQCAVNDDLTTAIHVYSRRMITDKPGNSFYHIFVFSSNL